MAIIEGITAAKAALEVSTRLMDLLNRPDVDTDEVRRKVQEMLVHLVSTNSALSDAQVENMELRRTIEKQNDLKALRADMQFRPDGGFFVRDSEEGEVPYCPECWVHQDKLMPLVCLDINGMYKCLTHKHVFRTAGFLAYEERMRKERDFSDPYGGPGSWMSR